VFLTPVMQFSFTRLTKAVTRVVGNLFSSSIERKQKGEDDKKDDNPHTKEDFGKALLAGIVFENLQLSSFLLRGTLSEHG